MRATEFLPEKINFDSLKPGKEYHKSILGGKYHLYAKTKDEPNLPPGIIVYVTDKDDPKLQNTLDAIGYGRYIPKGDNLEVSFVNVKQEYRRQGIASAMYNFVRELGNDIAPSSAQSADAKAFWSAGAGVGKSDIAKPEPTPEPKPEPAITPRKPSLLQKFKRAFA
jgi:GNAT superfamily N-acetyltransferase